MSDDRHGDGALVETRTVPNLKAQVEIQAAEITRLKAVIAAKDARQCSICTATVASYPEGMCCHCYEMPWPLAALTTDATQTEGEG